MKKRKKTRRVPTNSLITPTDPMALILYVSIGIVLAGYCVYISIECCMYRQTTGILLLSDKETISEEVYKPSRVSGYYRSTENYTLYHESYRYFVDGKQYTGSRYSRMIIYPEIRYPTRSIVVYYNRYLPQYSALAPVTPLYWLINNALFLLYIAVSVIVRIFRKKRR